MLKLVINHAEKSINIRKEHRCASVQLNSFIVTELLWGCWLNEGMRTPECYGILPYMKDE